MKIIASPSEPIERIDELWMPPGMCALVGDEDIAFLKNGKITVMSREEVGQIAGNVYEQFIKKHTVAVKLFDEYLSLNDFRRMMAQIDAELV